MGVTSLRVGDIVNRRYRILTPLGQGGFANVYRAEDLSLKTICALKENLDYWDESLRQFEREAHIMAGLRHPSLPRVIDYFTLPGEGQYLVMDYIEGYNLQEILDRITQPLIERKILGWIVQICDALTYLHCQTPPVIHRDIKPANIKITPANQAVLVDFGVAKTFDPNTRTTLAARAVTPGFSPVEQYGTGTTDARADQYALAATLYTLLTRKRPPESIDRVSGAELPPPRRLNSAISPHVERAILRAMELRADSRFETVATFKNALLTPDRLNGANGVFAEQSLDQNGAWAFLDTPGIKPGIAVQGNARPGSKGSSPLSLKTISRLEWINIPAGEFLFGAEKENYKLATFEIARTPVTNLQYQLFLAENPQQPAPLYWRGRSSPVGKESHPVVRVSLEDVLAFCRWAGCRLPSEQEWEKAARGEDGRSFPWGEDWQDGRYCNSFEARFKGTTPVDRYPEGVSPFGLWDMVGNVWEWTASQHQGPILQIVRGGSWRSFSQYALHITNRSFLLPGEKKDDLGFRCARSR